MSRETKDSLNMVLKMVKDRSLLKYMYSSFSLVIEEET